MKKKIAIAIHGGAGALTKKSYSKKEIKEYLRVLKECQCMGSELLKDGKKATTVCVEVLKIMENCPLFNAGIGSVYSSSAVQEMDASIMDGCSGEVGGVSLLKRIKNPILGAELVMKNSIHSLLAGEGAELFLKDNGLDFVDPIIFKSEKRLEQLNDAKKNKIISLDHSSKMGTVGCSVLDKYGNLASATSTGGMTNKHSGRVSDSSIIGAGTWADEIVAVSGTGTGDQFIAGALAYDISALMNYKNYTMERSALLVLDKLKKMGGSGGFAIVNNKGETLLPFNSLGMFRAWWSSDGQSGIAIYKE